MLNSTVHTYLTPVAAAGLTIIMIGAAAVSAIGMGATAGLFPAAVGVLTTWVAFSRAHVGPPAVRVARQAV
jgi:energy-converting hydrogenase Eha subunit A